MQAEPYFDCIFPKSVIRVLDVIRDWIMYFKWYRPLKHERNPHRRLELQLWLEISGVHLGGVSSGVEREAFKKNYYDKITMEMEKAAVRQTLLSMLRSHKYTVFQKEAIADVCSSLGMEEAFDDIALVREAAARSMSMSQLFRFKCAQARERRRHKLI